MDKELLRKTMATFSSSFINNNMNNNFELILIPKLNVSFMLENIKSDVEFKCKILEWVSRPALKACPYKRDRLNIKYRQDILNNINKVLDTYFSEKDIDLIYTKLGNGINRDLAIKFVLSGYDLKLLED